ncbi:DUF7681 family protein [Rubrimonas cliftonensis]|uniref:Acb2/Tad1 hairpin domain-containing protein n=1 Tax=Rubrimonas cliftonensis TaxID=89524 RepID=A0A1H3W666_9RHOB|nr:hypothetical protein [Rubrimonas cliftonensis]SDZ82490.1 hypothetical protein SAMN05444370_101536 [Rubrimonas cliftonensis]
MTAHTQMSSTQAANARAIREHGDDMLCFFDSLGQSRELDQAKVRLEEALMWAVKHATKG